MRRRRPVSRKRRPFSRKRKSKISRTIALKDKRGDRHTFTWDNYAYYTSGASTPSAAQVLTQSTSSTVVFHVVWRMIDMIGTSSAYAVMWDQFKVNWVEIVFTPRMQLPIATAVQTSGTTTGIAATQSDDNWFYTAIDYDGWSSLTTYGSVQNHSKKQRHNPFKKSRTKFIPRVLAPLVNSNTATTLTQNEARFCGWETSVNALEHYGLWVATPMGSATTVPWSVDVQTRINVSMRERQF